MGRKFSIMGLPMESQSGTNYDPCPRLCRETELLVEGFPSCNSHVIISRSQLMCILWSPNEDRVWLCFTPCFPKQSQSRLQFVFFLVSLIYNYMSNIMVTRLPLSSRPPIYPFTVTVHQHGKMMKNHCLLCVVQPSPCPPPPTLMFPFLILVKLLCVRHTHLQIRSHLTKVL